MLAETEMSLHHQYHVHWLWQLVLDTCIFFGFCLYHGNIRRLHCCKSCLSFPSAVVICTTASLASCCTCCTCTSLEILGLFFLFFLNFHDLFRLAMKCTDQMKNGIAFLVGVFKLGRALRHSCLRARWHTNTCTHKQTHTGVWLTGERGVLPLYQQPTPSPILAAFTTFIPHRFVTHLSLLLHVGIFSTPTALFPGLKQVGLHLIWGTGESPILWSRANLTPDPGPPMALQPLHIWFWSRWAAVNISAFWRPAWSTTNLVKKIN